MTYHLYRVHLEFETVGPHGHICKDCVVALLWNQCTVAARVETEAFGTVRRPIMGECGVGS
jgi:hypothetical protein